MGIATPERVQPRPRFRRPVGAPSAPPAQAPSRLERAWQRFRRGHMLPLAILALLDVIMLRHVLFTSGVPASMDAGFLYSRLPFFDSHHLHSFTGWLPDPFGQVQQYSIYWLLAGFEGIFHSPIGVYKAAMLFTILATSASAYGFAFWLGRSRLAAGVAAGLYVFAPFSIAIWQLGHLNVGISYAVGPAAVWALWAAIRSEHWLPRVGLGLAGAALFLLTGGQGFYWLLPMLAVAAFELWRVESSSARRARALGLARTAAVAGLVFVVASAVQLLPWVAGLKAPFVGGGERYYIEQLSVHDRYSLPFLDNLLEVPQGSQFLTSDVSIAAAPFDSVFYRFMALVLLGVALVALATRYRRTALVLLAPTAAAWFLASGPYGPAGPIYRLFYNHLPYFSLLRVPNRWLMVSCLGLAMLVALAIAGVAREDWRGTWLGKTRGRGARIAAFAIWLGLITSTYGLLHGLPTRHLPADYANAYSTLKADHEDWRILTTPYYQSWMNAGNGDGSPVVYAADLGHTSTYFHGHATLDRGGWDPRAARFSTYLAELVKRGTSRSITKLLGAVGVKYVGIDPHFAVEVPRGQNSFFRRQSGLVPVVQRGKVTIYRNEYALPQAFATRESCIVAGGMQVLGDLAEQRSFSFAHTGLRFADQIAAVGGSEALSESLARSSCLIIGPGGEAALAALLVADETRDLAPLAPESWRGGETSPSLDIGADPTQAVELPPGKRLEASVDAPSRGRYEIWVAGLRGVDQDRVRVRVDEAETGSIDFESTVGSGIRWMRSAPIDLGEGRHTVELENAAGKDGADAQLTKLALVDPAAVDGIVSTIPDVRVIRVRGGTGPLDEGSLRVGEPLTSSSWRPDPSPGFVKTESIEGRGLDIAVIRTGRPHFTLARAEARGPVDISRPFALRFRGTGNGQVLYLNVLFDDKGRRAARFRFKDTSAAERLIYFSPLQPSSVSTSPDWSKVAAFTIASSSKERLPGGFEVDGPYEARGAKLTASFEEAGSRRDPFADAPDGTPALSPPAQTISDGATLTSPLNGRTLTFTQAYHPDWKLHAQEGAGSHSLALGFANAYDLDGPLIDGSLEFTSAKYGRIGMWISLAAWIGLVALMIRFATRRRRSEPS